MTKKMSRREDYLKLIYTLFRKGEVLGADLADELDIKCRYLKGLVENGAIEHSISPETCSALKQLLNERRVSI